VRGTGHVGREECCAATIKVREQRQSG